MSTNGPPETQRREKRSTRLGILVLVAIVVLIVALVVGSQLWDGEDDAPSVSIDAPVAMLHDLEAAA